MWLDQRSQGWRGQGPAWESGSRFQLWLRHGFSLSLLSFKLQGPSAPTQHSQGPASVPRLLPREMGALFSFSASSHLSNQHLLPSPLSAPAPAQVEGGGILLALLPQECGGDSDSQQSQLWGRQDRCSCVAKRKQGCATVGGGRDDIPSPYILLYIFADVISQELLYPKPCF